jgi:polysaccharide pyruvyl transferase WcaK-like protein
MVACGRLFSAKVAFVGVGANDITCPLTRWLVATAVRLAHHRSYRDEYTKAALTRMGIDTSEDDVHPDIAFARRPTRGRSGARVRRPGGNGLSRRGGGSVAR